MIAVGELRKKIIAEGLAFAGNRGYCAVLGVVASLDPAAGDAHAGLRW